MVLAQAKGIQDVPPRTVSSSQPAPGEGLERQARGGKSHACAGQQRCLGLGQQGEGAMGEMPEARGGAGGSPLDKCREIKLSIASKVDIR